MSDASDARVRRGEIHRDGVRDGVVRDEMDRDEMDRDEMDRDEMDRDEVDRLVASWNRERPDLDTSPMAVLSRVTRLAWHVERARRAAFAGHGLEAFEFDVLVALRRSGAPHELSPGRLAEETMVTSGTMTNRLDRLERRDLVRRLPDPRDGRAVRVRLTEAGRSRVDAALGDLLDRERALLGGLTQHERTTLADLLRRVGTAFTGPGGVVGG